MIEAGGYILATLALGILAWHLVRASQAQHPQAQAWMLMCKANDIMDDRIRQAFAKLKNPPQPTPEAQAALRQARETVAEEIEHAAATGWEGLLEEIPIVD